MIVVLVTAVVSVYLHYETDENARKTTISRWLGKKCLGPVLADSVRRVFRNTSIFFLAKLLLLARKKIPLVIYAIYTNRFILLLQLLYQDFS